MSVRALQINYEVTELLPQRQYMAEWEGEYLGVFLCSPGYEEQALSSVVPSRVKLCLLLYACVQLEDFTDGHCGVGRRRQGELQA